MNAVTIWAGLCVFVWIWEADCTPAMTKSTVVWKQARTHITCKPLADLSKPRVHPHAAGISR